VLLLDFPRQRFAILDSAQRLPQEIVDHASFVPIDYRNGHAFVPLRLGNRVVEDFFFDTGASLFPLTTTPDLWRTLTGRTGNESANTRWRVNSWGKSLEMIGAPLVGDMRIGGLRVSDPLVFHERPDGTGQDFFSTVPYRVGGHFGNALFYDRHVIILDLPRRRFGILSRP